MLLNSFFLYLIFFVFLLIYVCSIATIAKFGVASVAMLIAKKAIDHLVTIFLPKLQLGCASLMVILYQVIK